MVSNRTKGQGLVWVIKYVNDFYIRAILNSYKNYFRNSIINIKKYN